MATRMTGAILTISPNPAYAGATLVPDITTPSETTLACAPIRFYRQTAAFEHQSEFPLHLVKAAEFPSVVVNASKQLVLRVHEQKRQ